MSIGLGATIGALARVEVVVSSAARARIESVDPSTIVATSAEIPNVGDGMPAGGVYTGPAVFSRRIDTVRCFSAAGLSLLLTSCRVDFSGLNDLLASNATFLSFPGTRIAPGTFQHPSVDGTDAAGAYFVAFDVSEDTPRLALFPFEGGTGCRTGRADTYRSFAFDFGPRSELPPFVSFLEKIPNSDGTTTRRLHLVNPKCEEPLSPVEDSGFALVPSWSFDPPGYLAVTSRGDLVFLDPWAPRRETLSTGASSVQLTDQKVWYIEGGQVTVRDQSLKLVKRFGTSVTELHVTANDAPRAAFVDGTDLYVVSDALEEPKKIDSDVCQVTFADGSSGHAIAYHSPCASGRLVLYTNATRPRTPADDKKYVLGDTALGAPTVDFVANPGLAFFVSSDDPKADNGALWGGEIGKPPEHIADNPNLGRAKAPLVSNRGGSWQVVVDVSPNGGRLLSWKPGTAAREVARGVAEVDGTLAIVSYDGTQGDLVEIDGGTVIRTLSRHVPTGGVAAATNGLDLRLAVLSDVASGVGTLSVAPSANAPLERIATGVPASGSVNGFYFVQNLDAYGYLHDYDVKEGVGTLGVRVNATGDTFDVGIRASDWFEVGWPEPGVWYVIPSGKKAGIWFARLL